LATLPSFILPQTILPIVHHCCVQLPANPIPHPSIILPIIFHAHHPKQKKKKWPSKIINPPLNPLSSDWIANGPKIGFKAGQ
jgi:hypothetical protein